MMDWSSAAASASGSAACSPGKGAVIRRTRCRSRKISGESSSPSACRKPLKPVARRLAFFLAMIFGALSQKSSTKSVTHTVTIREDSAL